jgi:hypothetical protein
LTARLPERLVAVEEDRLVEKLGVGWRAVDVPRKNKVAGVNIRFDAEERKAFLRY